MNITLQPKVWTDLYAATGISVGTQLKVFNLTSSTARLASTETTPTPSDDHFTLRADGTSPVNMKGDEGAWAMCLTTGAIDVIEYTSPITE